MTIYGKNKSYYIFDKEDYFRIIEEELGEGFIKYLNQEIINPLEKEARSYEGTNEYYERQADGLYNAMNDINLELTALQDYIGTAKRLNRDKMNKMLVNVFKEINECI